MPPFNCDKPCIYIEVHSFRRHIACKSTKCQHLHEFILIEGLYPAQPYWAAEETKIETINSPPSISWGLLSALWWVSVKVNTYVTNLVDLTAFRDGLVDLTAFRHGFHDWTCIGQKTVALQDPNLHGPITDCNLRLYQRSAQSQTPHWQTWWALQHSGWTLLWLSPVN